MNKDIWIKNQIPFKEQTGLDVKGNESIYIQWLNTVFTIQIFEQEKAQTALLTQIRDLKK